MGGFNEVSLPNWQNLVRRIFGLTGPGGNVAALAPEIQGIVELQPDQAEFHRLRLRKNWGANQSNSGGATQATVALVNPASSGKLIVVTRCQAFAQGTVVNQTVELTLDTETNITADAPNLGTRVGALDSREVAAGGAGVPGAVLRFGPSVGGTGGFKLYGGPTQSAAFEAPAFDYTEPGIVLLPGFGVMVSLIAVGGSITVNYVWYEKPLEPEEAFNP